MNPMFSNQTSVKLSSFLFFWIVAICSYCIDYKYNAFARLRSLFSTPRYYFMEMVSLPFEGSKSVARYLISYKTLVEENNYLKQQLKIKTAVLQSFNWLELENVRLKNFLKFSKSQSHSLSLANIVQVNLDPFKHQITINKGSKEGVYIGQPIINAEGVLGSIISVDKYSSIGILLSDTSYAIPVLNLRNGLRAIALGTGDWNNLTLQHIPKTADIKEGDIFVTSGLGGKYPPGYVVGKVANVNKEVNLPFASILVTISANLNNYTEVLLVYSNTNNLEKNQ